MISRAANSSIHYICRIILGLLKHLHLNLTQLFSQSLYIPSLRARDSLPRKPSSHATDRILSLWHSFANTDVLSRPIANSEVKPSNASLAQGLSFLTTFLQASIYWRKNKSPSPSRPAWFFLSTYLHWKIILSNDEDPPHSLCKLRGHHCLSLPRLQLMHNGKT